jgi:hypothetical protein
MTTSTPTVRISPCTRAMTTRSRRGQTPMKLPPFLLAIALAAATVGCGDDGGSPDAGGECVPGTAGCPCLEGSICQGGLVCDMGLCRAVASVEIDVGDPNARSCECVVVEQNADVLGVLFGEGTEGVHVRESPRTALTFTRRTDTPFPAGAVRVQRSEGMGTLQLQRVRCFDREGNVLPGTPLRLAQ